MMKLICSLSLIIFISGCAGFGTKLKRFITGKGTGTKTQRIKPTSINQKPYHYSGPNRKYKRKTAKTVQQGAQLGAKSASLWVMEGQGAYLFSQNVVRMIGDSMSVRIEGDPKEQIEAKVNIIQKLLKKIEQRKALRKGQKVATNAKAKEKGAGAGSNKNSDKGETPFKIKLVPTRITERMVDGNYRVKGSQPFMIGKSEYKVIVSGIIRSEDFNEEGVSASQLLDPKFDIVRSRRGRKIL